MNDFGNIKAFLLIAFFMLITAVSLHGQQSRQQLEQQKKENLRKLEEAEQILSKTTQKKKASLGQLSALTYKIETQQALTNSINKELSLLNSELNEIGSIINALEDDLEKMKEEYAAMIYAAQKSNNGLSKLAFVFSAESFYQMFRRVKYMQYYSELRRNQAKQIESVRSMLVEQQASIEKVRIEKSTLLQEQIYRNRELEKLRKQQSTMVAQLRTREKEIKADIEDRRESLKNLEKAIADLIKKEMTKTASASRKNKYELTPEAKELSNSFAGNKKKLLWPVEAGFISQKFGTHPHPIYKNLKIRNDGVDIQTNSNEPIRAVFEGEVKNIAFIPGYNNVVMIQHGDYFTVYAKLKEVYVKSGDKINIKQALGTVYTNQEGTAELQFQVWKNQTKLDPEGWLFKK